MLFLSLSLSLSLLCSLYDMGVCPCPFDLAYDILTWFVPCANLVRLNLCQSCAASVFVTLSRAKFVPTLCDTLCANVFWQPCATIFLPTLCGGGLRPHKLRTRMQIKGKLPYICICIYIMLPGEFHHRYDPTNATRWRWYNKARQTKRNKTKK